jgi:exodeoxyribonuclease V alpha subunit
VLSGTLERVTYADPATGWLVLRVAPDAASSVPPAGVLFRPSSVTAVGRAAGPAPAEGLRLRLSGSWGRHATHGEQFEFELLEVLPPADAAGLVKYLASSAFEGIGETLAQRIVDELGPEALELILVAPERLARVRGLRPAVREKLVATLAAELGAHRERAALAGMGLGPFQSAAVLQKLGPGAVAAVREDPYLLADGVPGIGFTIADRVATALGLSPDDPRRLRAGLVAALRGAAEEGHSLLGRAQAIERAEALLRQGPLGEERWRAALAELVAAGSVLVEEEPEGEPTLWLPWLLHSERRLAEHLCALARAAAAPLAGPAELAAAERRVGIELDPGQRQAVLGLLAAPVGLLTGGPGVGKTTIVRLVVSLAEAAGARVRLASPTGRAAKRLAEATGRAATTIHRLLGWDPKEGRFAHGDKKPLGLDLLVLDEVSMLDLALAQSLVRALRPPSRLVLVGDPDQLPSVGPGNVLADLIASGRFPVHRLTRIFRQAERGRIVENAHRILRGEPPLLPEPGDLASDFYLFPADDPAQAAERLIEVVTERIPRTFGMDWMRDVQVIAPMYKGECGVDALNARLRQALGHGGREVVRGERVWRTGDRVIQTRNDYDKEVFNGDLGRIRDVSPEGSVVVAYPERDVVYQPRELSDLQPAFAITVHRAQGSEFPAVVIPLAMQHALLLQRNLLYTAVTRARRLAVLVGSRRALSLALASADQRERQSRLVRRLRATR